MPVVPYMDITVWLMMLSATLDRHVICDPISNYSQSHVNNKVYCSVMSGCYVLVGVGNNGCCGNVVEKRVHITEFGTLNIMIVFKRIIFVISVDLVWEDLLPLPVN